LLITTKKKIYLFQADVSTVLIQEGMFAIFFPEDFAPALHTGQQPDERKKVVVKVRL
jgi:beta-galactosidase beta subunit